jgi:hypothetical protein
MGKSEDICLIFHVFLLFFLFDGIVDTFSLNKSLMVSLPPERRKGATQVYSLQGSMFFSVNKMKEQLKI